jgi:hypothetical protein
MTLDELTAFCVEKIQQENPLRIPEVPPVASSLEEFEAAFLENTERLFATMDYRGSLADAITQVYASLYEELNLTPQEAQALPRDTELPTRTNALALKLSLFPVEMTKIDFR